MKRQLPKNVRQIGNVSDSSKIYVEDYVDTFFNQLCEKADQEMIGAFLVGETVQEEEQDYIYVYGAIRMKELLVKGKDFVVEEDVWKKALETCKEYFGDAEILGWFITGGEHPLEVNHNINKIHQKYFPREKSIFVTKNARDKEERFYVYKYRDMMECGGHYVYYEKNVEMQNYMIATRKKGGFIPTEMIEDRVTKSFRSIIREKEEKNEQKGHPHLIYAMSTFLVLVVLVIGVTMLNNYDKMKEAQNSLGGMAENDPKDDDESIQASGDNINSDTGNQEVEKPDTETPKNPQDSTDTGDGDTTPPETEKPSTEEPTVSDTPTVEPETYIVQKGDTLETISRNKYGDIRQVDAICKLNGLEDGNLIFIGQKLLLP